MPIPQNSQAQLRVLAGEKKNARRVAWVEHRSSSTILWSNSKRHGLLTILSLMDDTDPSEPAGMIAQSEFRVQFFIRAKNQSRAAWVMGIASCYCYPFALLSPEKLMAKHDRSVGAVKLRTPDHVRSVKIVKNPELS